MNSAILFTLSVVVIAGLAIAAVFARAGISPIAYFKTKTGKGVLTGIILFVAIGLFTVWATAEPRDGIWSKTEGTWFSHADVFIGLDNTNKLSPMCERGDVSSRLTSNGGLYVSLYESYDERFELYSKYTHHSCAFNSDDKSYDALGIGASYRLWSK